MNSPAPPEIVDWFTSRIPSDWFTGPLSIAADEEIVVVGPLSEDSTLKAVQEFRERTRAERMQIAAEAEQVFRRKVSWGAAVGARRELFTTVSLPVMTRLRQPERAVLDTLVAAGVVRSRSEALGWCVRLVGERESTWLAGLQEALSAVEKARGKGPTASS